MCTQEEMCDLLGFTFYFKQDETSKYLIKPAKCLMTIDKTGALDVQTDSQGEALTLK